MEHENGHVVATARIELTPQETKLRNLLLDVARYIDESKEIKEVLELRFAGGWVRDKLLRIPSHDIDTAINAMTGHTFSLKLREYLDKPENRKKHGIDEVSNLHKIAANPEKSKHLETVTTKLLGYDVDFVNLRKETYSDDSRNPQMEFGTAREDALRRDATVNALFYNIHTDQVEDFTGGLQDMNDRLIRTPMQPYQTFVDDPLRILRLIRFAARLGFSIDPEVERTMSEPVILNALHIKISRERVGVEIEKMLKNENALTALKFIDRLGLYSTIFTDPTHDSIPVVDSSVWHTAYMCLDAILSNNSPRSIHQILMRTSESWELAWLLAALVPWAPLGAPRQTRPGAKRLPPYASMAAREGIKANHRTLNVITGAFRNWEAILKMKNDFVRGEVYTKQRDVVGMAIRRWDADGGQWKLHALLAIMVESLAAVEVAEGASLSSPKHLPDTDNRSRYGPFLATWQQFFDHLTDLEILEAATTKRIIDGKELSKALGARPGVWMAPALDVVMAWQFRNPDMTDPKGAIDEVRQRAEELGIPMN
jgi:tRNA nucleotidyltransferase/poly(A) polymerase